MNDIILTDTELGFEVRRVGFEEIFELRRTTLLRPGMPPQVAKYEGDDMSSTWHIGAYRIRHGDTTKVISCASYIYQPKSDKVPAWRIRGFCTNSHNRGNKAGTLVLTAAEKALLESAPRIRVFWGIVPIRAADFFGKHGWSVSPERYPTPFAGHNVDVTRVVA